MARRTSTQIKKETADVDTPKEEFFVCVSNSDPLRLALLESRKFTLQSMKIFEALRLIRTKKVNAKNNLRKDVRKISLLINRIRQSIPEVTLPPEPKIVVNKVPSEEGKTVTIKKVKSKKEKKPGSYNSSDLDKIENALSDIEGQLSEIS
jgi:hypothetical protein